MTIDKVGQKIHELIQTKTRKELCTFGIQWMRHQYRAKREGFTGVAKCQFVAIMNKIHKT